MNRSPRNLLLLALFLALAAPIAQAKNSDAKPFNFLSEQSLDPMQLLPDPAKTDSPEFKSELEVILKLQRSRTPEDSARANSEKTFDVFAFHDAVGDWFAADKLPLTARLFKKIDKDSKYFSSKAKDFYARPRPRFVDKNVAPLMDDAEPSYPSGHSTRATLMAEILANLLPDKRDALSDRGRQIGWDRVIAGVHYPSDVTAGRMLGKALAQQFLANPAFQTELAKVKEELAAARPVPVGADAK